MANIPVISSATHRFFGAASPPRWTMIYCCMIIASFGTSWRGSMATIRRDMGPLVHSGLHRSRRPMIQPRRRTGQACVRWPGRVPHWPRWPPPLSSTDRC